MENLLFLGVPILKYIIVLLCGLVCPPVCQIHTVGLLKIFFLKVCVNTEIQIRGGNEDNSKIIFSYFSMKTYGVTPRQDKRVLIMGHKICFKGEIWIIYP